MLFGRFGAECYTLVNMEELLNFDPHLTPFSLVGKYIIKEVGRGTPLGLDNSWIALDSFGGNFKNYDRHIWMDFNSITALDQLPSDWLNSIIIDWSTWRYMKPILVASKWRKLLRVGCSLCFESGYNIYD
jgi:hypothetical protein